jgi:hypothetical protein
VPQQQQLLLLLLLLCTQPSMPSFAMPSPCRHITTCCCTVLSQGHAAFYHDVITLTESQHTTCRHHAMLICTTVTNALCCNSDLGEAMACPQL